MEQINIQPLLESMHDFGVCLDQETDAILNNNFENYEALIENKQLHYAHYYSSIVNFKKKLAQEKLDEKQKLAVTESQDCLTEKLAKNDDALALVDEVSETIVRIFQSALEDVESQTDYYDHYGNEKAMRSPRASSLTFSKDI